ncbi:MAG TPA: hypothetical protein VF666_18555 [Pyrinomonadaceae bacterium]|jgi:hypothetical protein
MSFALLLGMFTLGSSSASAGKDCSGGFTVTLSDGRVFSGEQDSVIAVGAGQTAQITGKFVSFTVDLNTFTVTNYTLNSDITANQPAVIFARKEPLHGRVLTSSLSIDINSEQMVLQRSGAGQSMKIQAKDCSEGGIFQMEPEPTIEVLHQLGPGFAYCVDSLGRVLIVSGASPFVGRESPEAATLVSPSPLSAIVGANTSRWLIQSGGRMGMVTGEDAVEPLGAPCSAATTNPTPSPTPGVTPSPTPGATPSPTPGATPSPSPSPTPGATPSPTPIATPSPSPSPTPGATPSPSPTPGATPSPSPTPGATPSPSPSPSPSPVGNDVRIRAELVGAPFNGQSPRAEVEYRAEGGERRLEIEVENVNLPSGTLLNVLVDNVQIGTIRLEGGGKGELELRTDNGQFVPLVNSRSRVVIATQGGVTLVAGAFAPTFLPNPSPTPVNGEIRIEARLAGASINGLTPKGKAKWRSRDGRLKFNVEVEKVNLPVGTRLNVLVDGVKVGELVITTLLEHELELDTNNGQSVPQIHDGTTVVVTNQAGTTILSGTFNTFVTPVAGNDIDNSNLFVQQQYLDFFDREADDSGLGFWTNQIASCGNDEACIERRRINTSGAFFLSIEFQNTGYLLYRLHKASFGVMPRRAEFLIDMQALGQGVVVNQAGWEEKLTANKRALIERWVSRQAFLNVFAGMSNAQFVDALFQRAGVTPDPQERLNLIAGLDSGTETRATVLLRVAENQAFYKKEYNPAFVLMQYFGYLHRNPDEGPDRDLSGFNFWLKKLNEFDGDFHRAEMVKAFIRAGEYRGRFEW